MRAVKVSLGRHTTFTRGLNWFSCVEALMASKRTPKFTVTVGTIRHSSCSRRCRSSR